MIPKSFYDGLYMWRRLAREDSVHHRHMGVVNNLSAVANSIATGHLMQGTRW